jgi:hypothetical protein
VLGSYLLVSNSIDELRAVAESLASKDDYARALEEIQDLESVRHQNVWGYRRFSPGFVDQLALPGRSVFKPRTHAISFAVDWQRKSCTLRIVLSSSEGEATISALKRAPFMPPFKSRSNGIWQANFGLPGTDRETTDRVFVAMALLGFGGFV